MKLLNVKFGKTALALLALVGLTLTSAKAADNKTATVGKTVTISVTASGTQPFTYQWSKDGVAISGATSANYVISSVNSTHAGTYRATVTNKAGSIQSDASVLTVVAAPAAGSPDGYASLVTGGAAGTTVTVSSAADLRTYAEATGAYVINVSGVINLGGSLLVKSNKTIQGVDTNASIIGNLDLSGGGVSNVIIRGLCITNPGTNISNGSYTDGGNGITLRNASNVFITHCSIYNCAANLIEISNGSDYVTVSWSDFYYASTQTMHRQAVFTGLAGSETKPLHITLHHNWWSDLCDQGMPAGTYGYVHLYNNYFDAANNSRGTVSSDNSQFFVERNVYNSIKDPLYKENIDTTKTAGRIRAIANTFTSCTGRAVDTGTDSIFTPIYSYEIDPAEDIALLVAQLAGNTGGATSATPTSSSASITGPSSAVSPGASFTLTAAPSGFTGTSYQWRHNNVDIAGATSSTYSVASMQTANAGTYTVVIGLSSGNFVVSTPIDVTLGTGTSPDPGSSSSSPSGSSVAAAAASSSGGGAPGFIYLVALIAVGMARLLSRRRHAA